VGKEKLEKNKRVEKRYCYSRARQRGTIQAENGQ